MQHGQQLQDLLKLFEAIRHDSDEAIDMLSRETREVASVIAAEVKGRFQGEKGLRDLFQTLADRVDVQLMTLNRCFFPFVFLFHLLDVVFMVCML